MTANVAGKTATVNVNLNARTGVSITGPTTPVAAGTPVTFTVGVGAAPANHSRRDDRLWRRRAKLARSAQRVDAGPARLHRRRAPTAASATATEASGFTETVATFVTILPQQPPSVIIQAAPTNPVPGQTVIFTAVVSGATSTILRYEWTLRGRNARHRLRRPATARPRRSLAPARGSSGEGRPGVRVRRVTARRSSPCSPVAAEEIRQITGVCS